jgi:hypothetical protein
MEYRMSAPVAGYNIHHLPPNYDFTCPDVTLQLFDALVGFDDTHFRFIEQRSPNSATIAAHRKEIVGKKMVRFIGDANVGNRATQKRLFMIWKARTAGGFTNPAVFEYLARAAARELRPQTMR